MKQLKEYPNLHQLYTGSINRLQKPCLICLLLFVLAFATFLIDHFPFGLTLAMMGMIFPAILFGVLWLVFSARTKKLLRAFSQEKLRAIDDALPSVSMYENLCVTDQAVISTKMGLELVPMETLLWVYTEVTVTKLYGIIPIHRDTMLIMAGRDRKKYAFRIKNSQKAVPFLQEELLKHRLDIVFGNEPGLEEIYKNDIDRMIAFSQECAKKRQKESDLLQTKGD